MSKSAQSQGREARRPGHFGWTDWRQILFRVWVQVGKHRLTLVAAGIAFYAMLALFPAIAAIIGIYGMVANPGVVADQMQLLEALVPADAYALIRAQVADLVASQSTSISVTALGALAVALWVARLGVSALIQGLSIAYNEGEDRSLPRQILVAIVLTAILIALLLVALLAIVVVPVMLDILPLGPFNEWLASLARWPIAGIAMVVGLGIVYRYGPNRSSARVAWVTWGAVVATVLWLVASVAFSFYVANFASYNETYGSIGAVVGMLMWFWISAFVVLLGAELNAEMEHHTRPDTTVGGDQPQGERGAFVADHVAGESGSGPGQHVQQDRDRAD